MWLAILRLLLQLASAVVSHVRDKRLLEAGRAEAVAAGIREADDAIRRARAARDAAGRVSDDRFDRDKRG